LRKSGTLHILSFLLKHNSARFGFLVENLKVPRKTIALRLKEMLKLRLIEFQGRKDETGKIYNVYVLTSAGKKLTERIGLSTIERLIQIDQELLRNRDQK
jgi:DNA-binding HxlR family transcriptional regulator